jgi:haloalkane dehalogenase
MDVLRTPELRFANLEDYPFTPNYVEVDSLRVHYVDEGAADAPSIVLLHGEPSWSYLYRSMIPPLVEAGFRCIAPDLIGFGRSDKPVDRDRYTYEAHLGWLRGALDAIGLESHHLFCQDWGGLLGLRLVADAPERFLSVVAANTFLPTGREPTGEAFLRWRSFSQTVETFDVGRMIDKATSRPVSAGAIAAYDAPFPDESYKAGARAFPMLVPIDPDTADAKANQAAWGRLTKFERPFVTMFSDGDPITRGGDRFFQQAVPGARGQPHRTIENAGHFLQEDAGAALGSHVAEFLRHVASAD